MLGRCAEVLRGCRLGILGRWPGVIEGRADGRVRVEELVGRRTVERIGGVEERDGTDGRNDGR